MALHAPPSPSPLSGQKMNSCTELAYRNGSFLTTFQRPHFSGCRLKLRRNFPPPLLPPTGRAWINKPSYYFLLRSVRADKKTYMYVVRSCSLVRRASAPLL